MASSLFLFQVMFEEYQFAGVYIAIQAVLTLYAQGIQHILSCPVLSNTHTCNIIYTLIVCMNSCHGLHISTTHMTLL